ncbi:MAG: hypothetical protein QOJ63_1409 [Solirubrobacteraceae bacterium]|jgi:uncharacterized protein (TIGR02246 family)|nr:hypothetical protein [Solirubrobacteraceae bacterium]
MSDVDTSEIEVRALYRRVLDAWNRASAEDFAAVFAEDGEVVGFDGSQIVGRAAIAAELGRIFADHATGAYMGKVRSVRPLGSGAALLRAVAGMVPAGRSDLEPRLNAVQALVAERREGAWRAVLYQNTPAQLHGRPELAAELTEELRHELRG